MKKILHLSDLHVGFGSMKERFEELTRNIIAELQPASDYVIVVTGDLAEKPVGTNQYQEVRDLFGRLEGAGFDILSVPGNHDFNNGVVLDSSFRERFNETFLGDPQITYPTVRCIDGVAFIGLNSLEEEFHWYDCALADGELGKEQLQRLDDLLGDSTLQACAQRVIYLHHHPFDPVPLSQLKDSRKLRRIIQKHGNVDALLYGHNHMGRICNGTWGVTRCYDGGTSTGKQPGVKRQRLIDLSQPPTSDTNADFYKNGNGKKNSPASQEKTCLSTSTGDL